MSETTRDHKTRLGKFFNFANNGITIAGIVITTLSALLIVTFMIVELSGGLKHNPYIGLFAYVALPLVFTLGLVEIPLGMWLRWRKLIREGASDEEMSSYPRLDFNNPRLRRIGALVLGLTVINGIILGSTSFLAIEKMESVEFCGTTCQGPGSRDGGPSGNQGPPLFQEDRPRSTDGRLPNERRRYCLSCNRNCPFL